MSFVAALFDAVMWVSAFCLGVLALAAALDVVEAFVKGRMLRVWVCALQFFGLATLSLTVVLMLVRGDA